MIWACAVAGSQFANSHSCDDFPVNIQITRGVQHRESERGDFQCERDPMTAPHVPCSPLRRRHRTQFWLRAWRGNTRSAESWSPPPPRTPCPTYAVWFWLIVAHNWLTAFCIHFWWTKNERERRRRSSGAESLKVDWNFLSIMLELLTTSLWLFACWWKVFLWKFYVS